jgi:hypothetical protein
MSDRRFDPLKPTEDEIRAVQDPLPAHLRAHAAEWTAPAEDEVSRLLARRPRGTLPRPRSGLWMLAAAALVLFSMQRVILTTIATTPPPLANAALDLPHGPLQLSGDIDAEGIGEIEIIEQSVDGARVAVVGGAVTFTVDPDGIARDLRVQAGPVEVRITGTRFTVARDPESGAVEVGVERGSVAVRYPGGTRDLEAGDRWIWTPPEALPVPADIVPPSLVVVPEDVLQPPPPEVEKSTGLLIGILDAVESGQSPEAVLSMTGTFLRVYPDSPGREEVEAIRLTAMAEAMPMPMPSGQ